MIDRVRSWLDSDRCPQEGVRLMQEAGASSLTLRMIRANPKGSVRLMAHWLCRFFSLPYRPEPTRPKSFRQEFPFLGEASCPTELQALASIKMTRYHAYVNLHSKLTDCRSLKECAAVSRELINSYLENRAIWEELNYYKEHRSLLGNHPVFAAFRRRKELLSCSLRELLQRQRRLRANIWRVKDELKKGDKPHLEIERCTRLKILEAELAEVNRLLDEE